MTAGCDGDNCGASSLDLLQVPPQQQATDIVVDVVLEGRVTDSSEATIELFLDPGRRMVSKDYIVLRPESRALSLRPGSSKRLRWTAVAAPATELPYSVVLSLTSADPVQINKATTSIEVSPAEG